MKSLVPPLGSACCTGLAILILAWTAPAGLSQTSTWDGDGGDGLWSTDANWNTPPMDLLSQILVFQGDQGTVADNDLAADRRVDEIRFTNDGSTVAKSAAFNLTGNRIQFDDKIITTASAVAITDTIGHDLRMIGSRTVTTNANHHLIISGNVAANSNNRNLSKNGTGTLTLSGTNNPSGHINALFINNGTVKISADRNLGDNDVGLGSGTNTGTLIYTGTGETINNQFRVGDDNGGATRTGGGIILNSGTGTLILSSGPFNQARTNVAGDSDRDLAFGGTSDIVVSGAIVNNTVDATVSVTKNDSNDLRLDGASTYTGATTINSGELILNGSLTSDVGLANGASLAGEGSTTGGINFGTGGRSNLHVDGSTAGAISAGGVVDTTDGVDVVVDRAAAGAFAVLQYGTWTNGAGVGDFAVDPTLKSERVGAAVFSDDGVGTISLDLGYQTKTWTGATDNDWDEGVVTGTDNWSAGGGDNKFLDGDLVIFDSTAPSNRRDIDLTSDVAPTSVTFADNTGYRIRDGGGKLSVEDGGLNFLGNASGADVRIDAEIVGNGTITKGRTTAGAGNVGQTIITHDNKDFAGVTVIEQGDLEIRHVDALGNEKTNTITMRDRGDDAQLIVRAEGEVKNDFIISNTGNNKTIRFDDTTNNSSPPKTLTLSGDFTMLEESGSLVFSTEGQRESLGDTHVLTVTGKISSSSPADDGWILKTDQGTLVLGNASNDFTGRLGINSGTVKVGSIGNINEASHAGASRATDYNIRLGNRGTGATPLGNSGTLVYTGGAEETDRKVRIGSSSSRSPNENTTGGGTIANNGSGSLVFTNAIFNSPEQTTIGRIGPRNLTLAGSFTGVNEIQGVIANNYVGPDFVDETVGITVDTAGTWVLSGDNTYTGATVVTNGTLVVDGDLASASVSVADGATLSGSGDLGGAVTITGLHSPGNSPGVQMFGDLNYATNADFLWELTANNAIDDMIQTGPTFEFDQVVVSGDLDFAGSNTFDLDFDLAGSSVDWLDTFWETGNRWLVYDVGGQTTGLANLQLNVANWQDASGDLFDDVFPLGRFYLTQAGSDVYLNFAPVPEPSTVLVLLGGFLSMMLGRRRRKLGSNAH